MNTNTDADCQRKWQSCDFHPMMSRDDGRECIDVLVQVSSTDVNVLFELMKRVQRYDINIKSGVGTRLTEVQTNLLNLSVPLEHVSAFRKELEQDFKPEVSRVVTVDEFGSVRKFFANYNLSVHIEADKPGVLAYLLLELAGFGVQVVSLTATTGRSNLGGMWGRAEAKLRVPEDLDPSLLWNVLRLKADQEEWMLSLEGRDGAFSRNNVSLVSEKS